MLHKEQSCHKLLAPASWIRVAILYNIIRNASQWVSESLNLKAQVMFQELSYSTSKLLIPNSRLAA
jgi:hypothetical protein